MNSETWRKSSYSGGSGGNCVAVGQSSGVLVRDTKQDGDPARVTLSFSADAWQTYLATLR